MFSRRTLLLGLTGLSAAVWSGGLAPAAMALSPNSGTRKNIQPRLLTIRRPRHLVTDLTQRAYGSVLFLSDSTSAVRRSQMAKHLSSSNVGPFCIDINLGRLLARNRSYSGSAITAVRQARNAGFDAQSYVIALGFSDILNNMQDPRIVDAPVPTVVSIVEEVLTEIGTDRTVSILNLHGATTASGARARIFNEGLAQLAETWPNLRVIDWATLAGPHRAWHMRDGIHYRWRGIYARFDFVMSAIRTTAKQHLESPPPTTTAPPATDVPPTNPTALAR